MKITFGGPNATVIELAGCPLLMTFRGFVLQQRNLLALMNGYLPF